MILLIRIRSLLMWLVYPGYLVISSTVCIILNILFNKRSIDNWVIKTWAKTTCRMFNVHVLVEGAEKVPKGRGCLYLFNHTSFFDIWSMSGYLPSFRFGSKIEIFKIPVFGWAIRRVGVLPIDRENRKDVIKVYDHTRTRIQNGERFALSPEGTRQEREVLGPFKSGPFILAIQSHAPIVPVIITNASKVMGKHSFIPNWNHWKTTIHIRLLQPIYTDEMTIENKAQLMDQVWDIMNKNLIELQGRHSGEPLIRINT